MRTHLLLPSTKHGFKGVMYTFVALLLLAMLPVGSAFADDEDNAQLKMSPALLQLATEHPNDTLHVIIQRRIKQPKADDELAGVGGRKKKDLGIVNGFAAELTGKAVLKLARSKRTRWISIDAPMVSTAASIACSRAGGAAVTATFTNNTAATVNVFLLDNNCQELPYGSVAPGATVSGTAYTKQIWRVRTTGGLLLNEVAVAGNTTLVITNTNPCVNSVANASFRGLMAAYSFDEGTGASVADSANNGHAGTISAATWTNSGKFGKALSFNGTSSIVTIPDSNLLDLSSGMTLEAWVYPTALLGNWRTVLLKGGPNGMAYGLYAANDFLMPAGEFMTAGSWNAATGLTILPLNTWSHLATTYDGSTLRMYVNGIQVGSQSITSALNSSTSPLEIGANTVWGEYFAGRIDNVRVYNRALPQTELAANMSRPVQAAPVFCNVATSAINANRVWNQLGRQGSGIGVAVVDSGINTVDALKNESGTSSRIVAVSNQTTEANGNDLYGHGTHVAGIIGGNGRGTLGVANGVAPQVNLINVKVGDSNGKVLMSDLVDGLQWINANKATYNIKVVNLSLNSTVAEPYHVSALDAAVEILWFNGITVVVAAGNNGTGSASTLYPPANDPFVIAVGAADDMGSAGINDDVIPAFSAFGTTENGFAKPDLVAPGRNIVSLLAGTTATAYTSKPVHRIDSALFRMSGTSMAAPMVSGAVALLLQDEPNLTPDQVKYRLRATADTAWPGYNAAKAGAGYLDVYAVVNGNSTASANTGIAPSQMLYTGTNPISWNSVNWNSVNWNSVNWNSVNWNSVNWNSVNWNSALWDS